MLWGLCAVQPSQARELFAEETMVLWSLPPWRRDLLPDSDGGLGDHPQPPLVSSAGLICLTVTFPSVVDVAA